jgi:perosamine synthetase
MVVRKDKIPICEPHITNKDVARVSSAVESGWISSKSTIVSRFEGAFAEYIGTKYAVACSSGTTALHVALLAAGIGKGDEVIIPTFTMGATAFAVYYCGARPVLVDADPETYCIDPEEIEGAVSEHTRAIIPVHIYGHACDMDEIKKVATAYNLIVIEDSAEAIGTKYRGKNAGSIGLIGCFSFYPNKAITTGEGGMITTNYTNIFSRARHYINMCFGMGADRYLHSDIGYNYRMSGMQAALGVSQLERVDELVQKRIDNAKLYNDLFEGFKKVIPPTEKPWCTNSYWLYAILLDGTVSVYKFIEEMSKMGVETRPFFKPIHRQPFYKCRREEYPVADYISQHGVLLPSSPTLTEDNIHYICDCVKKVLR